MLRFDSPVFIPRHTPTAVRESSPAEKFVLETLCFIPRRAQEKGEPLTLTLARTLDEMDEDFEKAALAAALNPTNYQRKHEGTPLSPDVLDAVQALIAKRRSLESQVSFDSDCLLAKLRALTGIPHALLDDEAMQRAIPHGTLQKFRQSLVSVMAPGRSMQPMDSPDAREIDEAFNRTHAMWASLADALRDRYLANHTRTAWSQNDLRLARALCAASTGQAANALLDLAGPLVEHMLHEASECAGFVDALARRPDTAAQWPARQALIETRRTARLNIAKAASALFGKDTPKTRLGALCLPATAANALARSVAGHTLAIGTADSALDKTLEWLRTEPSFSKALAQANAASDALTPLLTQAAPELGQLLDTLVLRAASAGLNEDTRTTLTDHARDVVAAHLADSPGVLAPRLSEQIAAQRSHILAQGLAPQGAALGAALLALQQATQDHARRTVTLSQQLAAIGMDAAPALSDALAQAATLDVAPRKSEANRLKKIFDALPPEEKQRLVKHHTLGATKIPPSIASTLKTWREQGDPAFGALADL
jgi:hypothetical protein